MVYLGVRAPVRCRVGECTVFRYSAGSKSSIIFSVARNKSLVHETGRLHTEINLIFPQFSVAKSISECLSPLLEPD